jgi:hypothetical protein
MMRQAMNAAISAAIATMTRVHRIRRQLMVEW